jgi:DNA-binding NtrC family response regulator
MRGLAAAIQKVAPHDTTVLVHGESGTGKELVAEAIHAASRRAGGPLVKVNCAALVETLLLSELFGHEKGSFTGAASRRRGRFEAAEGGTLFLDEIGDISPATQVALLRVLQERSFERVGGTTTIRADVRVVCATHRNLRALVERGLFREDLYYRLCGVVLEVPALRERLGDLGELADHLLVRIARERGTELKRVSSRALEALRRHAWPGNVRELENALRAASLFAEGEEIELEDFIDNVESLRSLGTSTRSGVSVPPSPGSELAPSSGVGSLASACAHSTHGQSAHGSSASATEAQPPRGASSSAEGSVGTMSVPEVAYETIRSGTSLHDVKRLIERECVARALSDAGGNITRAATLLGMKRPRLSQLVKQYGLGQGDADGGVDGAMVDGAMEEEADG